MEKESQNAVIRELVDAALSDEDLKNICFDHFNDVYDKFTAGQTRGERILFLVEHVSRQGLENRLKREIKKKIPINTRNITELKKRKVPIVITILMTTDGVF